MRFITGFVIGALIFGGIAIARDKVVDFSEDSIPALNSILNKLWYAVDDRTIRDDTPYLEWHDVDANKAFMIHVDFEDDCDWIWALYIGTNYDGEDFNVSATYRKPFLGFNATGSVFMPYVKTGATQAAAGAVAGELWADSDIEYTLKLGQ